MNRLIASTAIIAAIAAAHAANAREQVSPRFDTPGTGLYHDQGYYVPAFPGEVHRSQDDQDQRRYFVSPTHEHQPQVGNSTRMKKEKIRYRDENG